MDGKGRYQNLFKKGKNRVFYPDVSCAISSDQNLTQLSTFAIFRDGAGTGKEQKLKEKKIGPGPIPLLTAYLRSRTQAAVSTSEVIYRAPSVFWVISLGAWLRTHPWKSNSRPGHFPPALLFLRSHLLLSSAWLTTAISLVPMRHQTWRTEPRAR